MKKYKPSDFPGMARPLRRALIATLNRGEPSRKVTEAEKAKQRAESARLEALAALTSDSKRIISA